MTSLLQRIAKAAIEAYSLRNNERNLKPKLSKLAEMMREVRSTDINLSPKLEEMVEILNENTEDNSPVAYVDICEHEKFTLSMFVLKNGAEIPLHDHPGMYGVIKVVRGNILVRTYTADTSGTLGFNGESSRPATITSEVLIGETDNVCLLSPKDNNFHEISAPNGAAAFLDVLIPPYSDDNRICNFYKVINTAKEQKKVILEPTCPPPYFWTVQISKYIGAPIAD